MASAQHDITVSVSHIHAHGDPAARHPIMVRFSFKPQQYPPAPMPTIAESVNGINISYNCNTVTPTKIRPVTVK